MGADDFIRKPFSQRLLVERVKAILRRANPKDAATQKESEAKVLERGRLKMDPERHTCTWDGVPVTLTVTEFLILQALATRPGVVKSRNALMDAAYDDQVYVDDRTIDSHIKRLRKKFKTVEPDFEMIETLYGVGYRFREVLRDEGGCCMTSEAHSDALWTNVGQAWRKSRWRLRLRWLRRTAEASFSSSLTRRIVSLNLSGLVILVLGFLWLNHFRADIIEARTQSLTTQAGIISAAIAASVAVDTDTIQLDPEKLLQLTPAGESAATANEEDVIEFSINPEKVGPGPTSSGDPDSDSRTNLRPGWGAPARHPDAELATVPPAPEAGTLSQNSSWLQRTLSQLRRAFEPREPPRSVGGWTTNGKSLPEVAEALSGGTASFVRTDNETIVSVAAPIKAQGGDQGALVLSTQGRTSTRSSLASALRYSGSLGVIAGVMLILSLALANTIAEPVRKLSEAAERVRRGIKSRQPIPDFTNRADEIGHLSRALGEMTEALYSRIDAIESFAADVAHELKNPLTSLRSAVETLPR